MVSLLTASSWRWGEHAAAFLDGNRAAIRMNPAGLDPLRQEGVNDGLVRLELVGRAAHDWVSGRRATSPDEGVDYWHEIHTTARHVEAPT